MLKRASKWGLYMCSAGKSLPSAKSYIEKFSKMQSELKIQTQRLRSLEQQVRMANPGGTGRKSKQDDSV